MENVNANWAELNNDILAQVMEKLSLKDYFRCGAVCVPWGIVFADEIHNRKKDYSFPWLLIPPIVDVDEFNQQFSSDDDDDDYDYVEDDEDTEADKELDQDEEFKSEEKERKMINYDTEEYRMRTLYNAFTNSVVDIHVKFPHNKHCRGSSFGWLITVEKTENNRFHAQLFNPFLSDKLAINLPPFDEIAKFDPQIRTIQKYEATYLGKAVLSDNPTFSRGDFTVMALVGPYCQLACLLPGASDWIPVEWKKWAADHFDDIIYCSKSQQFYAINHYAGTVLAIDILEGGHIETRIFAPPAERWKGDCEPPVAYRYLVESPSGGLLQVLHYSYHGRFEVLELNQITKEWTQIHSLEDCALFVGNNCSRYVSTVDVPSCKSNCIYYTARWSALNRPIILRPEDNGVFNMQDGTVQPHYPLHSGISISSAIWLDPTFPIGLGSTYICTD